MQEFASSGQFLIVWYDAVNSYSTTGKDRIHIGNGALDVVNMRANSLETDTLNVKSRIDAGTIVATGNITTKGTLTASKIEGDFPMDIPDDLEVNTVTASGTVKASNGEFDTVTVRGENATAKLTSIGVVVSAPSNAYVNTISPNLLDLKRRENSIFYLETSQINTMLKINNLPVGIPTGSFPVNMQPGQIFLDEDTKNNGTYVLRIKK